MAERHVRPHGGVPDWILQVGVGREDNLKVVEGFTNFLGRRWPIFERVLVVAKPGARDGGAELLRYQVAGASSLSKPLILRPFMMANWAARASWRRAASTATWQCCHSGLAKSASTGEIVEVLEQTFATAILGGALCAGGD
ncbi:MAG: hypothetical protein AABX89_07605 [Candidatus Thermoplasmatota archaeon]